MNKEFITKLDELKERLCKHLHADPIDYEFEDIKEDSRLYTRDRIYIALSNKYMDNYYECAKNLAHEMRHYFQILYASNFDDQLAQLWRRSLGMAHGADEGVEYLEQDIELDAYAFTKYYLTKYEGMEVVHPNKEYEDMIMFYINRFEGILSLEEEKE